MDILICEYSRKKIIKYFFEKNHRTLENLCFINLTICLSNTSGLHVVFELPPTISLSHNV